MKRKFAVFYFLHRLLKISLFLILSVKMAFGIVPYDVYANYFLNAQILLKRYPLIVKFRQQKFVIYRDLCLSLGKFLEL